MLTMDVELRRRWSQLPTPMMLPWVEQPVLVLDRGTPWVYGPVEQDPGMTERGMALPRPVIRRLAELAKLELPFQRLAIAHELDPDGPAAGYLPALRAGPRPCTADEARTLVGPPPCTPPSGEPLGSSTRSSAARPARPRKRCSTPSSSASSARRSSCRARPLATTR